MRKMIQTGVILLLTAMIFGSAVYAGDGRTLNYHMGGRWDWESGKDRDVVNLDFRGSKLEVEYIDRDGDRLGVVEISKVYELTIDGERIDLDSSQTALVGEFYETAASLDKSIDELIDDAAGIGLAGGGLALKALGRVLKLVSANYDTDDLERDMERDAAKLEKRAEELEERAEDIEAMAYDLEDLAEELCDEIPELDRLGWF